jgi:LPXTG-motif cell wall-anchored protein
MKRTTSLITTGALSVGTIALLGSVAPGVASANDCGPTTFNMTQLKTAFTSSLSGLYGDATEEMLPNGLRLTTPADDPNGDSSVGYFMSGLEIPLAQATAQSNFVLDATRAAGQPIENHPTYELYLDLDSSDGLSPEEAILVYWEPAAGDPDGVWSSALGQLSEISPEISDGWDANLVDVSAAYPTATIMSAGFQLLYQPGADVTVHGMTFGCNDFVFSSGPVDPDPVNEAPIAAFTTSIVDGTVTLDASGSTDDSAVASYAWDYGDGNTGTGNPVDWTYEESGTYTVTLIVTDDEDVASAPVTQVVNVTVPGGGDPTDPTDPPAPTEYNTPLPSTGADVLGMAVIGGLVLAGGGTGLAVSRRRKAGATS